jgi:hypothetical protein
MITIAGGIILALVLIFCVLVALRGEADNIIAYGLGAAVGLPVIGASGWSFQGWLLTAGAFFLALGIYSWSSRSRVSETLSCFFWALCMFALVVFLFVEPMKHGALHAASTVSLP